MIDLYTGSVRVAIASLLACKDASAEAAVEI